MKKQILILLAAAILCSIFGSALAETDSSLQSRSAGILTVPSIIIYPPSISDVSDETMLVPYELRGTTTLTCKTNEKWHVSLFYYNDGKLGNGTIYYHENGRAYNLLFISEEINSAWSNMLVDGYNDGDNQHRMSYEYSLNGELKSIGFGIGAVIDYDYDFNNARWYHYNDQWQQEYVDLDVPINPSAFAPPTIVFTGETLVLWDDALCELDSILSYVANGSKFYDGESCENAVLDYMAIKCENIKEHGEEDERRVGKWLVKDRDYTVAYYNETTETENDTVNAGLIRVTVTGIKGHTGTLVSHYRIEPKALYKDNITLNDNGTPNPDVHVEVLLPSGFRVLKKDKDYTVSYSALSNTTTKVVVKGIGNYTSEITKEYPIFENVLELPEGLTDIETEAFAGTAFETVIVPDGCTSISAGAFIDCPNLQEIIVPADCDIADGACDASVTITRR